MKRNYQEKINKTLENASEPLDIEKNRVEVDIGNYNTALMHVPERFQTLKGRNVDRRH